MPKQILAIAPVNLKIAGRIYSIEAGKSLAVSDAESQLIMSGGSANKFKLIGDVMSTVPISIHNANLPRYFPPQVTAPEVTTHKDWATPHTEGTVPDPVLSSVGQLSNTGEDFFDAVMDIAAASLPLPAQQDTDYPDAAVTVSPERSMITPDTHWSKVKAHLSALEKENPVNYEAVKEIKQMFSKSASIQQQCDRILATQV